MGFYIRKSFSAGPIRLNLSKGGLGVSAGVRGARIGISGSGRAYTHVGRYGLYHRQYLDAAAANSRSGVPRAARPTVELTIAEGPTYSTPDIESTGPTVRDGLRAPTRSAAPFVAWGLIGVLAGAVLAGTDLGWRAAGPSFLFAGLGFVIAATRARRTAAESRCCDALLGAVDSLSEYGEEYAQGLRTRLAERGVSDAARSYYAKRAYLALLQAVIEDGAMNDDEATRLTTVETAFQLDAQFTAAARVEVFRQVYLGVVADHVLDVDEERRLASVRAHLEIPASDLREEDQVIAQLREVRAVQGGELPVVESTVKLQEGEVCHYEAPGRLLKSKILQSVQRDGVRYKMRGFETANEGTLLVTSKRLLLVHEGTTSIPLARVLDVEVDADRNLLTITKDGAKTPVYITTPRAAIAGAIVARLARS